MVSNSLQLDQPQQVREFKGQHALRLQQDLQPLDKIIQVRHLRQHIVPDNQVGAVGLPRQFPSPPASPKNRTSVGTPFSTAAFGNVRRRLNAQHRNAAAYKVLQKIAVVARHLDHKALLAQPEARLHLCRSISRSA